MKFKGKLALSPKTATEEDKAKEKEKWCSLCHCCDKAYELESKLSFFKGLGHTLKADSPATRCIPKLTMTHLLKYDPAFVGLSYTFDHTAVKKTDSAEIMLGLQPAKNFYTYLKQ